MNILSRFGKKRFGHGIHPPTQKDITSAIPIRRLAFPPRLVVHLDQFIGVPAVPLVSKGQEVVRGEPIAKSGGFVSVPMHAPATGTVRGIEPMPSARGTITNAIIIDVQGGASQEVLYATPQPLDRLSRRELISAIQNTGLVGLGGAAFPTHVKYTSPPGDEHELDTLIVNGAECEPFLTADHRVMVEQTEDLLRGIRHVMRATDVKQAIIGIESNKPSAVAALERCLAGEAPPGEPPIRVQVVETKYPQGAEKILIKSLLGRTVQPGQLPRSVGVIVSNVGTLAQVGYLLPRGEGMVERVMTVVGIGVQRPGNYRVPIGTPLRFILQQVGYEGDVAKVILGGPMMGLAVSDLDTPVTKGVSGILVLSEPAVDAHVGQKWPCIRCARCVNACPMFLNPSLLGQLAAKHRYEEMAEKYNLTSCFECGCCSYVCPSHIPLVQYFRVAKAVNFQRAA
ncbi:electron transport complex subunit RsxC [Magnetospira thiophila]